MLRVKLTPRMPHRGRIQDLRKSPGPTGLNDKQETDSKEVKDTFSSLLKDFIARNENEIQKENHLLTFQIEAKKAEKIEKVKEKFKPLLTLDDLISKLPENSQLKKQFRSDFLKLLDKLFEKDNWDKANLTAKAHIEFLQKLLRLKSDILIKISGLYDAVKEKSYIDNALKMPSILLKFLSPEDLIDLRDQFVPLVELYEYVNKLFPPQSQQNPSVEAKGQPVSSHADFYHFALAVERFFDEVKGTSHFKKNQMALGMLFRKMVIPALKRLNDCYSHVHLSVRIAEVEDALKESKEHHSFGKIVQLTCELGVFNELARLKAVYQQRLDIAEEAERNGDKVLAALNRSLALAGKKAYDDLLSDAKQLFNPASPFHKLNDKIAALKCLSMDVAHAANVVHSPTRNAPALKARLDDKHLNEQPNTWKRNLGGLMALSIVAAAVVMILNPPTTLLALYWWSSYGLAAVGALALSVSAYIAYQGSQPTGLAKSMSDLYKQASKSQKLEQLPEQKRMVLGHL